VFFQELIEQHCVHCFVADTDHFWQAQVAAD
jgi:hypothetical protein